MVSVPRRSVAIPTLLRPVTEAAAVEVVEVVVVVEATECLALPLASWM
jgi:hypothetical protein